MTPRSPRRRALARALLADLLALVTLALATLATPTAVWAKDEDPNLNQALSKLAIVHGKRVLDSGHVDMGPKFDQGAWRFLTHDDVAKADANATSVWRYPDETVLRVLDEAKLTIPEDPAYSFLGAEPGSPVWVVPQTQDPDVVWLGWNTQDPEVMQNIDRGITLSLTGVQGPGTVNVYLQSGSFGKPQVLWDSRVPQAQSAWVDVNTHTHANWVFTQPGVYLLQLRADAKLVDGSTVSDTQIIRFAVGTGTSTEDALTAAWNGPATTGSASPPAAQAGDGSPAADGGPPAAQGPGQGEGQGPLVPILIGAIALVAGGLIAGVVVAVVRGNKAKRRTLAARTVPAMSGDGGSDDGGSNDGGGLR